MKKVRNGAANIVGWLAGKTGSKHAKGKLTSLQSRITPKEKGVRPKRIITQMARRSKRAADFPKWADWARFGLLGAGAGAAGGGHITAGALLGALGISGHFAFKKLESGAQKRLVASLVGRPRLTEAVCRRIVEPELEAKLRNFGNLFLSRAEAVKLRKSLLKNKRFDLVEFSADLRPLTQLGHLKAKFPRLTPRVVELCLKYYKTELRFPLPAKTRKTLEFSIKVINLLNRSGVELKTMRNIINRTFSSDRVPTGKKELVCLQLGDRVGRQMLNDPRVTEIVSNVLRDEGIRINVSKTMSSSGSKKVWKGFVEVKFLRARS